MKHEARRLSPREVRRSLFGAYWAVLPGLLFVSTLGAWLLVSAITMDVPLKERGVRIVVVCA